MAFDLDPVELLATALTAVLLAVPIAFPLAAALVAEPRRMRSGGGLGVGLGLLFGVILAAVSALVGPEQMILLLTSLGLVVGLLLALGLAVLMVLRRAGTRLAAVLGTLACLLIGLSVPAQSLPALYGLSQSVLVVLAAVVIEAMVAVALTAVLVTLSGRVRALRTGIAAGAATAGVLIMIEAVGNLLDTAAAAGPPTVTPALILVGAAFVIGCIAGAVWESVAARQTAAAPAGNQ